MQKACVLVVEDELIVAKDIQSRLLRLGYHVPASVDCASDVMTAVSNEKPDLILMDIMLKGNVDGIDAAKTIKERYNIPVVFLTANSDDETILRAKGAEPYGYLLKPFEDRELLTTIEMTLYKHEMNKKLNESRNWFMTMLTSIGEGVIATDCEGVVTFMNPIALDLLEISGEFIGTQFIDLFKAVHNETRSPVIVKDVFACPIDVKFSGADIVLLGSNGKADIPIDMTISPFKDTLGNCLGMVVAFKDISERKKNEKELSDANKRLEHQAERLKRINERVRGLCRKIDHKNKELQKLDDLKSEFISTVSHELRTPLTIIREGVALVTDEVLGGINEQQVDMLSDVLESVDRLAKIINELLDISKLESGKMKLRKEKLPTSSFMQKMIKEFSIKARAKNIDICAELDTNLSAIYADEDRLIQIMHNLLGNALKFTDSGGSIKLKAQEHGYYVRITVEDTGRGIAAEDVDALFDKFRQFGRTAGPGERGTGLGLSIAKSLIEMHNGSISVNSVLGKGTEFIFTIPRYYSAHERAFMRLKHVFDDYWKNVPADNSGFSLIVIYMQEIEGSTFSLDDKNIELLTEELNKTSKKCFFRDGDEFVVGDDGENYILLPNTDLNGAYAVCDKIRLALAANKSFAEIGGDKCNLSFGVSTLIDDAAGAQGILEKAREALTRKKLIAIVDDHPQVVRLLEFRISKDERFECCGLLSGKDLFYFVEEKVPDLIILDIMMPEMSGYEVVGRLKEDSRFRDIPIVLLTAMTVESQEMESLLPGSIPVVSKTEGFQNLMQIIDNLL